MTGLTTLKTQSHRRRGSQIVEFALIVPVLLTMVMGIIEYGFMVKNNLTIANAARDGARAAAVGELPSTIQTRVINEAKPMTVSTSQITMTRSTDQGATFPTTLGTSSSNTAKNDANSGDLIKVTVTVPYTPITGFFPFTRNKVLQTAVVMRRE